MRGALLLVLAAAAFAQQAGDALSRAADEAAAAAKAGDAKRLAALAQEKEPGGWLLAHELCARGEPDAAARLAGAAPGADFAGLAAYVDARKNAGDDAGARRALALADAHLRQGRADEALVAAESVPLEGDTAVTVALLDRRGYALAELDRLDDSRESFRAAGERAARIGDLRAAAATLDMSALIAHKLQSHGNAADAEKRLLAVHRARKDEEALTVCLTRLQSAYQGLNDLDSLVQLFDELLPRLEAKADRRALAAMTARAATVHVRAARYVRAEQLAERALALAEAAGDPVTVGQVLLSVASVQGALGQAEKARQSQLRAVKLLERAPPDYLALALVTAAQSCLSLRQYGEAIEHLERASGICEKTNTPYLAVVQCWLGCAYAAKGDDETGFGYLERGIRNALAARNPRIYAPCLAQAADAYIAAGGYARAIALLEEAFAVAEEARSRDYVVAARQSLAACFLATGKPGEALGHVDQCALIVGEIYRGLGEEQGAEARSKNAFVFRIGALAAMDLGDAARAFTYLEGGRAGSLLEALGGRRALAGSAVPEALRAEEAKARSAMMIAAARHEEAERARDFKAAQAARKELDAARGALNETIQRIQREAKAAAAILYPKAASLGEIQAALEDDEAIVLYDVPRAVPERAQPFAKRTMAVVVTRKECRAVALAPADAIVGVCDGLVFDDPEVDPAPRVAELRKLVVEPLALPKEAKRLLVSPSGSLSPVPLSFLFDDRAVSQIPSATTYGLLREGRSLRGEKVLALGDPSYHGSLKQLPHTRAEAEAVGGTVLLGDKATAEGLAAALGTEKRWRAVHLACHGLVDEQRPALSSLALTGGGLSAYEAMRMPFAADLVVLSACETGRGKIVSGEGLLGFSRAFMVAGAPRVIVSLWPVEDKATLLLMRRFYELWKGGTPAAEALRQAQEHVRKEKPHPMYWAAWQLWGLPE